MAVLPKPINRMIVIKEQDSQEFVREFNKNKITEDFLESYKKASNYLGNHSFKKKRIL